MEGCWFQTQDHQSCRFWNYDKSEFDTPSVLGDLNDKELEGIWKQEHSLSAYTADDQFKSYEELKERLDRTLKASYRPDPEVEEEEVAPEPVVSRTAAPSSNGEDDTLSYFAKLASED